MYKVVVNKQIPVSISFLHSICCEKGIGMHEAFYIYLHFYILALYLVCVLFGMLSLHLASLTLGAHAQRGLRYLVCVSVCLCVCVSVTQHLTFYVFNRATNDTNLLSGG